MDRLEDLQVGSKFYAVSSDKRAAYRTPYKVTAVRREVRAREWLVIEATKLMEPGNVFDFVGHFSHYPHDEQIVLEKSLST